MQPYSSFTGETSMDIMGRNLDQIFETINKRDDDNQNLGTLEVAMKGSITADFTVSRTSQIQHNLGYKPMFLTYFFSSGSNWFIPMPVIDYGNAFTGLQNRPLNSRVHGYTDESYLYIEWVGASQIPNQSYFYFIFKNPVA